MMISCILDFLTKLYNCKIILQFFNKVAVLAQLGERQTEEFENFGQLKFLEVLCSIHRNRIFIFGYSILNISVQPLLTLYYYLITITVLFGRSMKTEMIFIVISLK